MSCYAACTATQEKCIEITCSFLEVHMLIFQANDLRLYCVLIHTLNIGGRLTHEYTWLYKVIICLNV